MKETEEEKVRLHPSVLFIVRGLHPELHGVCVCVCVCVMFAILKKSQWSFDSQKCCVKHGIFL